MSQRPITRIAAAARLLAPETVSDEQARAELAEVKAILARRDARVRRAKAANAKARRARGEDV